MTVTLHPGARQDLEDAAAFYKREASAGVAARSLAEFERVVRLVHGNPTIGTPRSGDRRGYPTTGFPYTVIYRPALNGIQVLVVKHDRRRPGFGGSRG